MGNCVTGDSHSKNNNPVRTAPSTVNKKNHINSNKDALSNTAVKVETHKINNLSPILRPILSKYLV
jgi:hypothetical protein